MRFFVKIEKNGSVVELRADRNAKKRRFTNELATFNTEKHMITTDKYVLDTENLFVLKARNSCL